MAAGLTVWTKTLDKVLAVAKANSGIGINRAFQGYKRWANNENLEDQIRGLAAETQGYFFCQLKNAGYSDSTTSSRPEEFSIAAELVVYVPKDTTTDLNAAWDFACGLAMELSSAANFNEADRGLGIPVRCRFNLHNLDVVEKGGIAVFDFGRHGGGEITFLDP